MKKNNIILIGFMGVGKGTVARALVKASDMMAIDTDDIIERMENSAKWLAKNVKSTIIATGGGFYKQEKLNKIGKVVYLKSSFQGILDRIHSAPNAANKLKKRPLLQDMEAASKLFNERAPQYEEVADIIVDVEKKDINLIVEEILGQI